MFGCAPDGRSPHQITFNMLLTEDDHKFFRKLQDSIACYKRSDTDDIYQTVVAHNQQSLFRLAKYHPVMEQLLKQDIFWDFWNLSFTTYLQQSRDDYIDHEVLQLATDIHPLDKLRGCYFYRLAMETRSNLKNSYTQDELFFLALSAEYLNLQAVFELSKNAIRLTTKSTYFPETSVSLRENNERILKLAANYQFLGYFLLIQVLYEYYSRMDLSNVNPAERESTLQNIKNSFDYFVQCLPDNQTDSVVQIDTMAMLRKYNFLTERAWRNLNNSQAITIPEEISPYISEFVKSISFGLRNS